MAEINVKETVFIFDTTGLQARCEPRGLQLMLYIGSIVSCRLHQSRDRLDLLIISRINVAHCRRCEEGSVVEVKLTAERLVLVVKD